MSIYSICNVIGRFGMGALIDKLGYRKVYTICGICSVASSLCLMFANSLAMFYIAYVLLAVGFGATNCCHPVAVQETYGSKYAGGIFGICMLGYMIICTFGIGQGHRQLHCLHGLCHHRLHHRRHLLHHHPPAQETHAG